MYVNMMFLESFSIIDFVSLIALHVFSEIFYFNNIRTMAYVYWESEIDAIFIIIS